jgi:hypothetical protein
MYFFLRAKSPMWRIFCPETACSAAPLQLVSSPEVLQLAMLESFVNTVEKELEESKDRTVSTTCFRVFSIKLEG